MLSDDAIAYWALYRPWDEPYQVEQDLLLEGILHKVAGMAGAASLAFIGGTCLHKMYAPQPVFTNRVDRFKLGGVCQTL